MDDTTPPEHGDELREVEPRDADDVADASELVEHLERHRHGFEDTAGINPRRSQESSGDAEDSR